jgi:membrane-bound lytic murein transglycosylase C
MLMKKLVHLLSEKDDDGNAILENQLKNIEGVVVKPGLNDTEFAQEKVSQVLKDAKDYVGKDGKKRTSFSLNLKLRPDHKDVRINKYQKEISKQSKRFKINPAIAMAVTETESSFNPKATSPIPAYGLMQLVPASGARDAYTYVYGEDKFLGKRYLYKPNNNIELGCAYLGKIRHQYFQNIKDDEKALMCTVAAYNTGVGNVSRALTNSTKIAPAVKKVNKMSSQELYNTLLRDLKYEETRNYLKKVWERKEKYKA